MDFLCLSEISPRDEGVYAIYSFDKIYILHYLCVATWLIFGFSMTMDVFLLNGVPTSVFKLKVEI